MSLRRTLALSASVLCLALALGTAVIAQTGFGTWAHFLTLPWGFLAGSVLAFSLAALLEAPAPRVAFDPQPWGFGEAIGVAWKAFTSSPVILIIGLLFAITPTLISAGLVIWKAVVDAIAHLQTYGQLGAAATSAPVVFRSVLKTASVSLAVASVAVVVLLQPIMSAGWLGVAIRAARGEAPRFKDLFVGFKPRRAISLIGLNFLFTLPLVAPATVVGIGLATVNPPAYFTYAVILTVLALAGALLFVLPGLVLAPFYVIDADLRADDALRASWLATRGQRFLVFLYLVAFVPSLLIGLIAGGLGVVLTIVLYQVGFAYACTRLSARTERPLFAPEWGAKYLRAFLRIAFVVFAAAFGVACFLILRQPHQIRVGWSLFDAAVRVSAVLLGVALVMSLLAAVLPSILDVLERGGFSSFVGARHVRSQKSGFLTVISVLSIFGVGLSSCSLSSVSSIMGGFSADLKRKILGNNAHIVIDNDARAPWENWEGVVEKARAVPGVVGATPVVQGEVMVQSASNLAGVIVRGVDPSTIGNVIELKNNIEVGKFEYLADADKLRRLPADEVVGMGKNGERFLKGKDILPITDDLDPSVREAIAVKPFLPGVVIGRELAKTLHVYVGDDVTLVSPLGDLGPMGVLPRMKKFRVAAIFYSGMYEYDASHVYVELNVAQEYFGIPGKVHVVDLRTDNVQTTDVVTPIVQKAVARPELRVRDWREINRNLFSALKLERFAMFLILSIAIMVASFCIVCTLLLMVTEKGKEIAILKAMGASDSSILLTFIGEGIIIGAIGTAFGVTMSLALCLGLKWFGLPLNPEVYYIDRLPVHVDALDFVFVTLAALTICTGSTIYPAIAASKIRPVDGLRYE